LLRRAAVCNQWRRCPSPDLNNSPISPDTAHCGLLPLRAARGISVVAVVVAHACGLLGSLGAESAPDARVDIARGRLPDPAPAEVRARVRVLGGQTLTVAWHFGAAAAQSAMPLTIHIHRVTGTRRVPLADEQLVVAAEVIWSWSVPAVRGPARYEATLELPQPVVLEIEAADRNDHEAALKALANAKLTVTGATQGELAALRTLGLRPLAERAATGVGEAVLRVAAGGEDGAWRREVRFSRDALDEAVWAAGSGPRDWRARVPRDWIAPAVIATTEGRLRLVECLVEPPQLP